MMPVMTQSDKIELTYKMVQVLLSDVLKLKNKIKILEKNNEKENSKKMAQKK